MPKKTTAEYNENKNLPEINIGLVGHVDHGKTTLTERLTGKWTDTHSEEMKRGITIRLGYADATFYYCKKCKSYSNSKKCPKCFEDGEISRTVSFLDAPGHESLMATVLGATALMDGALLLISVDEKCPQPQTAEHLQALNSAGIEKIIIVQNKIDAVSAEKAEEHYEQIKQFVKGTVAENSPVIPVSAIYGANIDMLIETIENYIPTPKREIYASDRFYVARSFDVNKPGAKISELKGGVLGGSVVTGTFEKGDEIIISPGLKINEKYEILKTKISNIVQKNQNLNKTHPGGLIAIETSLDPSLSKGDGLAGNIVSHSRSVPEIYGKIKISYELFGSTSSKKIDSLKTGDALLITSGISRSIGIIKSLKKKIFEAELKIPIAADKGNQVAISKQINGRWHLIGTGRIEG
ncbi:MAG: translation initiation factor IF-2 subunit gamma [Candidatus Aenigmarchaeota archaeon]|nr:translation initiation factor IF-2 subunit gamma [Candidatus Aenigmarchaeota archaeon]